MKAKKTMIIILVFSLALGLLSACGEEKQSEKISVSEVAGGEEKQGEEFFENDFVYLPEYAEIELADKNMQFGFKSARVGDKIFLTAMKNESIAYIYSFDMENPKPEKLPDYEPIIVSELGQIEGSYVFSGIYNMSADKNGNIYIIETYIVEGAESSFIRKLDSSGKELLRVEIEKVKLSDEYVYFQNLALSPEGELCIISEGEEIKLYFADKNLNPIGEKTLSNVNQILGSAQSAEGKPYLMYLKGYRVQISEIDFEAKDIKKGVNIDRNAGYYYMYTDGGCYDFFLGDSANLYGCNVETGETEYILNFIDSGININSLGLLNSLENGDILALNDKSYTFFPGGGGNKFADSDQGYEMIYLTKTPKDKFPQVQTLTLACFFIDGYLSQQIIEFNKNSSDLKIIAKDYSVFETHGDSMAGERKLLAEIGAGIVPDIFCSKRGLRRSFIDRGLFIDLLPFIDADKELGGRDALVAPVLKASLTDGKLYTLSAGFSHNFCIAPSDLLPNKLVSIEDVKSAKEKLQENADYFDSYMDRSSFLYFSMIMAQDELVDFKEGTAMFDSQKFIDLLNLAKEIPEWNQSAIYEHPAVRMRDGKQLLMLTKNDEALLRYRGVSALMNGKISFCSLPGFDKVYSVFGLEDGLSISANCANPELAWKFVRTLVSAVDTFEDGNTKGAFPMNAKSFENLIGSLLKDHTHGMYISEEEQVEIYALTAKQRDAIMELFDETTVINELDTKIMEIINEETAAFFWGNKTAEDTAKAIQNRVSIYLSKEQVRK